jgi:hypothetical protein
MMCPRRSVVAKAAGNEQPNDNASKKELNKSVEKAIDAMKKDGVDEQVARKVRPLLRSCTDMPTVAASPASAPPRRERLAI